MYWLFWVAFVLGTQRMLTLGEQLMSCQLRAASVISSSRVMVIATLRCETYWYMVLEMTTWASAMLYNCPQATSLKSGQTRILTPKSAVVATSCVCHWNLKVRPDYCTWGRCVCKASTWLRLRLRVGALQRGLDTSLTLIGLQLQQLLFPKICFEFSEPHGSASLLGTIMCLAEASSLAAISAEISLWNNTKGKDADGLTLWGRRGGRQRVCEDNGSLGFPVRARLLTPIDFRVIWAWNKILLLLREAFPA